MSVQFRSEACMMTARELYAQGVWNKTLDLAHISDGVLQGKCRRLTHSESGNHGI